MFRRFLKALGLITTFALMAALAVPAMARPADRAHRPDRTHRQVFPSIIDLPTGFQPEGIVIAPGGTAYAGSLADGSIVAADLRTGTVTEVYGADGSPAVGIEYDRSSRLLYVAGDGAGTLEAVDPTTGKLIDRVAVIPAGSGFINDFAVYRDVVYVTESFGSNLYAVQRTDDGFGNVRPVELGGDFEAVEGFNANGIVALPDGTLIIVQSATGTLYNVDPDTGVTTALAWDGAAMSLPFGDGLELRGRTLYVVQNQLNRVAVLRLRPGATTSTVERFVTNNAFDVPTTVDTFGNRVYVVNARFGIDNPGKADYQIVGTPLRGTASK